MEQQTPIARKGALWTQVSLAFLLFLALSLFATQPAYAAKGEAWDGTIDTTWYSASGTSFTLNTPEQLAGLAAITNGTAAGIARDDFTGKTITLGADIILNETSASGSVSDGSQREWTPIGHIVQTKSMAETGSMTEYDYSGSFNGTFDGAGYVVKNIYKSGSDDFGGYSGLFGALGSSATVKRTGLDGGYLYGRVVGGIAAVSRVSLADATAGKMPLIDSCYNKATISGNGASTRGAGGIFGGFEAYLGSVDSYHAMARITNCYNAGTVSGSAGAPKGGIAGYGSVVISGCVNLGNVSPSNISGDIAGCVLEKGYYDPSHATGISNVYCGKVSHSNSDTSTAGVLYHKLVSPGDEDKGDEVAVKDADDVYYLEGYPFYSTYSVAHEMGDAFDLVRNDSWDYEFKLYWESDPSTSTLQALDDRYGITVNGLDGQFYTGQPVEPETSLTYYSGRYTLTEGVDYLVTFENNVEAGVNTASATFTGIGCYTGTYGPVSWSIENTDISTGSIDTIPDQWFYGSEITPNVTVRTAGGTVLKASDYTVTYEDNDKTGTATVTVTANAPLTGTLTTTFDIYQASSSLKGSGTEDDPFQLASKGDVQFLAHELNTGDKTGAYAAAYYKVMNDINAGPDDENSLSADPIAFGSGAKPFAGTIDGDGNTITLALSADTVSIEPSYSDGLGFIGRTAGDVAINDLTLKGTVEGPINAGGFVGNAAGSSIAFDSCVNNVAVRGAMYGYNDGGFVGTTSSSTVASFTKCDNLGAITAREDVDSAGGGAAAGFIGIAGNSVTFTECTNIGQVTSGRQQAGGFIAAAGGYSGSGSGDVTFEKCANLGDVASGTNGAVGGFVGYNQADGWTMNFTKCHNDGDIDAADNIGGGGFVGQQYCKANFTDCYNVGDISCHLGNSSWGSGRRGGFVGYRSRSVETTFTSVYNAGTIVPYSDKPGGAFIGTAQNGTVSFRQAYYREDSADVAYNASTTGWSPTTINGKVEPQNTDVMKTDLFLSMLSSSFSKDKTNVNEGYPILEDREIKDISLLPDPNIPTQAYNGEFSPNAQLRDGGTTLKENTDYLVYYVVVGDGKAKAVYKGIGDWTGTKEVEFDYTKCDIEDCTITLSPTVYQLPDDAAPFKPTVVVTSPSGDRLVEGSDFTVVYSNNKHAGTGMAVIAGKGDLHEGIATRPFVIKPGDIGQGTAEEAGMPTSPIAYDQYGPSFSGNTVHINVGDSRLTGYSEFQFEWEPADGTRVPFSSRSQIKEAGVLKLYAVADDPDWTGELFLGEFVYGINLATDVEIQGIQDAYPVSEEGVDFTSWTPVITASGEALVSNDGGSEYAINVFDEDGNEVSSPVTEPGTYTYKVVPTGSWYSAGYWSSTWVSNASRLFNEAAGTFEVVPSEYMLADENITGGVEDSYTATGASITPAPVVEKDGKTLEEGTDYTTSYVDADGSEVSEPTEPGIYTVVATGIAPYQGKATKQFTIDAVYLSVYKQKGTDEPELVKNYTKTQFEALATEGDAISGLYWSGGWSVDTAATYVTVDDLLFDAGVSEWADGASFSAAQGDFGKNFKYTYADAHGGLMWYPNSTEADYDTIGGRSVVPVLSITERSSSIGAVSGTETAAKAEEANVAKANRDNEPRIIVGVKAEDYAAKETGNMMGRRFVKNVDTVTVYYKEVDKSALEAAKKAAEDNDAATKKSADGKDVEPSDKYVTPADKQKLDDAIAEAKKVLDDPDATQEEVDAAVEDMKAAQAAYDAAKKPGKKQAPITTKQDISKATVTGVVDKWYAVDKAGKALAQAQKPVVKLNGKTLKEGTDYKLAYANNKARTSGDKKFGPTNKATSATVTITGIGAYTGKVSKSFQIKGVEVYRLYNPKSGEHLYTTDTNERKVLTSSYGWKYEGVAWYAVGKPARPGQPAQGNTTSKPVYRVYQPKTGEHHYTTDANEVKVLSTSHGWRNEGVFAYTNTDTAKDVAVQMNRLYNPKVSPVASHHHTADTNEVKVLTSSHGWKKEGISWYGC